MNDTILKAIIDQYALDLHSVHGIDHWKRVARIGEYLYQHTKADILVTILFAYIHDAKREDELYDPEHGLRAALFAKDLYDTGLLVITQQQLSQLMFSCKYHSDRTIKSDDITIQTCWDSDRLDLWRVGEETNPSYLNTDIAKQQKTIEYAASLV